MHIDRRRFAFAAAAALAAPSVLAQSREQPRVVGVLGYGARTDVEPGLSYFKAALLEGGFAEGRNLRFEYRFADYDYLKLNRLAVELVEARVDVVFAMTTWAAYAAQEATRTTPIVFSMVNDPVHVNLVKSLARPGGNITGISEASGELTAKRVQLMHEAFPDARNLGVVYDEDSAKACSLELTEITAASRQLGVRTRLLPYAEKRDLEQAFSDAQHGKIAALLVPTTYETLRFGAALSAASFSSRVPLMHANKYPVMAGGLMSYGPQPDWSFKRAGAYVARILNGAKPSELPVERPSRYELVINLKAARMMGVTIPDSILLRADQIIE
jgi:putative ABC transport system substrate-binding protein